MKRTCYSCKDSKLLEEFVYHKGRKNDREGICKVCKNEYLRNQPSYKAYKVKMKQKYADDKDYRKKMKAKAAKFREDNNERVLLSQARVRAIKGNLKFDIELSDILIPEICPILNLKLKRGIGIKSKYSPSIDRIDNSKGYIKGNICVVSYLANHMKANASKEELLNFAKNIKSYINGDDIV